MKLTEWANYNIECAAWYAMAKERAVECPQVYGFLSRMYCELAAMIIAGARA